jgi:hypothetical protein
MKIYISVPFLATPDNEILKLFWNDINNLKNALWSGTVQWLQKINAHRALLSYQICVKWVM